MAISINKIKDWRIRGKVNKLIDALSDPVMEDARSGAKVLRKGAQSMAPSLNEAA